MVRNQLNHLVSFQYVSWAQILNVCDVDVFSLVLLVHAGISARLRRGLFQRVCRLVYSLPYCNEVVEAE